MTVDLERPFQWPELPESWSAWNSEEYQMGIDESERMQKKMGPTADKEGISEDRRKSMREQAQALLEGREKWKPGMGRAGGVVVSRWVGRDWVNAGTGHI
jgi:large subunit ribosomal protein L23